MKHEPVPEQEEEARLCESVFVPSQFVEQNSNVFSLNTHKLNSGFFFYAVTNQGHNDFRSAFIFCLLQLWFKGLMT